jgi:hypothetical protein
MFNITRDPMRGYSRRVRTEKVDRNAHFRAFGETGGRSARSRGKPKGTTNEPEHSDRRGCWWNSDGVCRLDSGRGFA